MKTYTGVPQKNVIKMNEVRMESIRMPGDVGVTSKCPSR